MRRTTEQFIERSDTRDQAAEVLLGPAVATWAIRAHKRRLNSAVIVAKQAQIEHLSQKTCFLEKKRV
jgi:hypothetical protein